LDIFDILILKIKIKSEKKHIILLYFKIKKLKKPLKNLFCVTIADLHFFHVKSG
jgi:hypothetical protein